MNMCQENDSGNSVELDSEKGGKVAKKSIFIFK